MALDEFILPPHREWAHFIEAMKNHDLGAIWRAIGEAGIHAPSDSYHMTGLFQAVSGKNPEAYDWISRCVALEPHAVEAWYNLGVIAERSISISEANRNYLQALQRAPEHPPTHQALARLYRVLVGKVLCCPQEFEIINVEISTYCSLRCPGCGRTAHAPHFNKLMSLDRFTRLIENLPPAKTITLSGLGEPLLHPEVSSIVKHSKESGKFKKINMVSNLMTKRRENYDDLFLSGLDELRVSVDSLDPVLIQKLRTGSDLSLLNSTLGYLIGKGRSVTVNIVLSTDNKDDVINTLYKLNSMGKVAVSLQFYLDMGRPEGCMNLEDQEEILIKIKKARDHLENITLYGPMNLKSYQSYLCGSPWQTLTLDVNGDLMPCCLVRDPSIFGKANVIEQTLAEIWAAPEVRAFLTSFIEKSPDFCGGCFENIRVSEHQGYAPGVRPYLAGDVRAFPSAPHEKPPAT